MCNLGWGGINTKREIELLNSFPYKPDILIFSYSPDDIADIAEAYGIQNRGFTPYKNLNFCLKFLVVKSYFLNFLYWQFPQRDCENYGKFLETSYSNETVFNAHLNELQYFINYSKNNSIPLYVILFPYFSVKSRSLSYLKSIEKFFNKQNVEVINASDLVLGIPGNELIINKNDPHPNELANRIVADELINRLRKYDSL